MAYEALKQRQSAMWGSAPYQRVTAAIADIHEIVIERLDPRPGRRWLDLACGTGAVAERAATRGADVTGVDLAPALIDTAIERAAELCVEIDYRVGDCERLELPDAGFDAVSSTCGAMFAPDHSATARELGRVTRPGGRIALANWTPTGGVAGMFAVMAPFQPAPPPSSPFEWGDEHHVRALLGEWFELEFEQGVSTLRVPSAEDYWELYSTSYGPLKTLADSLGSRRETLRRAYIAFFESKYRENGGIAHTREYLLVLRRAPAQTPDDRPPSVPVCRARRAADPVPERSEQQREAADGLGRSGRLAAARAPVAATERGGSAGPALARRPSACGVCGAAAATASGAASPVATSSPLGRRLGRDPALQAAREVAHQPVGDVLDHAAAAEAREAAGDREVGDGLDAGAWRRSRGERVDDRRVRAALAALVGPLGLHASRGGRPRRPPRS